MIILSIFIITVHSTFSYTEVSCITHKTAFECRAWACVWSPMTNTCTNYFDSHSQCLQFVTPAQCMQKDECDWLISHKRCVGYDHTNAHGIDPEDMFEAWEDERQNPMFHFINPPPPGGSTPSSKFNIPSKSRPTTPDELPPVATNPGDGGGVPSDNSFGPDSGSGTIITMTTVGTTPTTTATTTSTTTSTPTTTTPAHRIEWVQCATLGLRHLCRGASGLMTTCMWDPSVHHCISRQNSDTVHFCLQFDLDWACEEQAICVWSFHTETCKAFSDAISNSPSETTAGRAQLQLSQKQSNVHPQQLLHLFGGVFFGLVFSFVAFMCLLQEKHPSEDKTQPILLDQL